MIDYMANRRCDRCGKVYNRVNKFQGWPVTNHGHRIGWVKVIQKVCTHCLRGPDIIEAVHDFNPKWRLPKRGVTQLTLPKKGKKG